MITTFLALKEVIILNKHGLNETNDNAVFEKKKDEKKILGYNNK